MPPRLVFDRLAVSEEFYICVWVSSALSGFLQQPDNMLVGVLATVMNLTCTKRTKTYKHIRTNCTN